MVLNILHSDKKKYDAGLKPRKTRARVNRKAILSSTTMKKAFKQFEQMDEAKVRETEVSVDEHLKMNDNYMRTGPYKAKKK